MLKRKEPFILPKKETKKPCTKPTVPEISLSEGEIEAFKGLLSSVNVLISYIFPLFIERDDYWERSGCKTAKAFARFCIDLDKFRAKVLATITGVPEKAKKYSSNIFSTGEVMELPGYGTRRLDLFLFFGDMDGCFKEEPKVWKNRFLVKRPKALKDMYNYEEKVEKTIAYYEKLFSLRSQLREKFCCC